MFRTGITARLMQHFFRRLFDNDVLDSDGETVTTVVRALAVAASPGLILAFFLQNSYPQRSTWGRIEDQLFFVLFSFAAMAGVAIFQWEMLFPERLDFLVLAPLPLRPGQLLAGKALALSGFLGLFLIASNLFGALMLPAVSKGAFWRMVWAQSIAAGLAGVFAASAVVAAGAVLLCVVPPVVFRRVLWVLQVLGTAVLGLLMIAYARFGDEIATVLEHPGWVVRFVPPIWFLGMYQRLLHGAEAQAFAQMAAHRAWVATGVAIASASLCYPLAWIRMQRMAVQGEATHALRPSRWGSQAQTHLIPKQTERAIFSFIGKTMSRNSRYQVYVAMYCGVGLALAISCSTGIAGRGGGRHVVLSRFGLHAVLPLLLFWAVAGLHATFAVPQILPARWIFRVAGVDFHACVQATRHWVVMIGCLLVTFTSLVCGRLHWGWRPLLVQAVWGVCFCVVLVESF
ncbi:MAG: hypothetical protein INR62_08655, partial [Rhodospirillales bacterium]|nr:hypothetical protein [Acetobacter sp.]